MLLRIALVVAIVAGLAAAALNFLQVKEKVQIVMRDRDTYLGERDTARKELSDTKTQLAKTKTSLDQTTKELNSAKTERETAVAEADRQKKEATRLNGELDKTRAERNEAQREVAAWKALGYTVDQIKGLVIELRDVTKERDGLTEVRKNLEFNLDRTKRRLAKFEDPDLKVQLPPNLTGKVIVVDPKWDFVVLDIGQNQGVKEDGEMLIGRAGKLVAKIHIFTVERDRCVANVLPGWRLTDVFEGDTAVVAQ